ncbi:MAG: hypothetical protein GY749_07640 [Desulfobacteraceae bacterium]|nr:hypothetical protein [Desulfobacteraceae bacterium]
MTASGVTCVISDQDKKPVVHSRDITEDLISGFINKDLPGWLLDSKEIKNLGWNIHLGLEKDKAYSVLKTVTIFGIIVLFTSLTVVIILV